MAALMQSNNDPVAVPNPLSGTPNPTISSPPDSIALLKQSKQDSNLTSIASAGLHVSRSRSPLSHMATTAATSGSMERPFEHEKEPEQSTSQVAREALGASEKQQASSLNDPMQVSSEQMQLDSHPPSGNIPDAFGAADNSTSLMASSTVASPGPMEDSVSQDGDRPRHRDDSDFQESSNKSFTYPMPTLPLGDPRRGLSLPNSGFHKGGQRSPSAKKHRCPYCSTEFTRHHNLKSHLLTHSQEKPYVCQTCQSRFRRLHDLKRHTKLHTGERPHICPKCGRRFARGDALARHNKGQGGCAGRRSSMGSYAPEDEYGDGGASTGAEDAMDGLVYAEPDRMDEEDERRLSMPSIRKHDAPPDTLTRSNTATSFQMRQPSTYPPLAANRPSPGGLLPPPSHAGSSASTSPISQTGNMTYPPPGQPSGTSVFQPTNMRESPKPLSPNMHQLGSENNVQLHRPHSPGMPQSFQQQPFSRTAPTQAPVANHSSSGLGLPPPQPGAPQLPPPPGMSSSDSRFTLHAQGSVQAPSSTAAKHTPSHSHSSNHGGPLTSKTSLETPSNNGTLLPGPHDPNYVDQSRDREDKLWAYIRSVHEELNGLKAEVATLRAKLASSNTNTLPASNINAVQLQAEGSNVSTGQR